MSDILFENHWEWEKKGDSWYSCHNIYAEVCLHFIGKTKAEIQVCLLLFDIFRFYNMLHIAVDFIDYSHRMFFFLFFFFTSSFILHWLAVLYLIDNEHWNGKEKKGNIYVKPATKWTNKIRLLPLLKRTLSKSYAIIQHQNQFQPFAIYEC